MKLKLSRTHSLLLVFANILYQVSSAYGSETSHQILVEPVLSKERKTAKENLPSKRDLTSNNVCFDPYDPIDKKFVKLLKERIYGNWEPPSHGKLASVVYRFNKGDGSLDNIKIHLSSGDQQTDFACISAVREASTFSTNTYLEDKTALEIIFRTGENVNKLNCADTFKSKHKVSDNNFLVCHFIPLEALQVVKGLDPNLIHNERNLRFITVDHSKSKEFEDFQKEWSLFLHARPGITPSDIQEKASQLQSRFSKLFELI